MSGAQEKNSVWRGFTDPTGLVGLLLTLGALALFFSLTTDSFFSVANFRTLANQVPEALVIATGMTFVLISGGIDLSVGSVMALSSGAFGFCLAQTSWPLAACLPAALLAGAFCGALNGALVAKWHVPSFIVTLGMLEAARGAAFLVTDSRMQYVGDRVQVLAELQWRGLSVSFAMALVVAIAAHTALTRSVFGRHVRATGSNEETARLCGVRTRLLRFKVFLLCGALTGLGGIIHTLRLSAADPNAGVGVELEAIAAVVIGGTSLSGGHGSVPRSVLGVLIIAALGSGLALMGAQEHTKRLITGAVIVGAVLLDRYRQQGAGAAQ